MRKLLTTAIVAMTLILLPVKKSEAVIGLAIGNPTVSVVGGVLGVSSYVFMASCHGDDLGCLGNIMLGIGGLIAGIIVLDSDQEAEVEFGPVDPRSPLHQKAFSEEELETYNSELEELNLVRQSVLAEVLRNPKAKVSEIWAEFGETLSPETLKVADFNGKMLVRSLKK